MKGILGEKQGRARNGLYIFFHSIEGNCTGDKFCPLAHLLRSDLIPEVWRRCSSNREIQKVLRHRMNYVKIQTKIKNQIRVLLIEQKEEIRNMVDGERLEETQVA